jgi:hypothetical protein
MERPFGPIDPNSEHQLWSEWTFQIHEHGRHVPFAHVQKEVARWLVKGFGSVGRARVEEIHSASGSHFVIRAQVEGQPAHDPGFVAHVRRQFATYFVYQGWGPLATSSVQARVLAGDMQDGQPRRQLVVMPTLPLPRPGVA